MDLSNPSRAALFTLNSGSEASCADANPDKLYLSLEDGRRRPTSEDVTGGLVSHGALKSRRLSVVGRKYP